MNYKVLVADNVNEYIRCEVSYGIYFDFLDKEKAFSFAHDMVDLGKDVCIMTED